MSRRHPDGVQFFIVVFGIALPIALLIVFTIAFAAGWTS